MWNEIKTDDDIELFMDTTGYLHDSVIVSMNYISGDYVSKSGGMRFSPIEEHSLLLVVDSDCIGRIELLFGGVRKFSANCFDDFYAHEILGCYLKFHTDLYGKRRDDRFIVWADGGFDPFEKTDSSLKDGGGVTYVIAETLKWRYKEDN